jgi:hypothetical protein
MQLFVDVCLEIMFKTNLDFLRNTRKVIYFKVSKTGTKA